MFKKLLAQVGIGAAKVDTRLYFDSLAPGEMVEGEVYITGGDVSQKIDDIYIYVVTEYLREEEDTAITEECILMQYRLSERFNLEAKEEIVIPFSFPLPEETPLTLTSQPVYLRTGLDIPIAVDPKDIDYIEVHPHPLMQAVFDALENLGFQLHEIDCQYNTHFGGRYPFVQEFEFRPMGKYQGHLDELEIIFSLYSEDLEVFLEIDKRARGFGGFLEEAFDLDERYVQFQVTLDDLNLPMGELEGMIEEIIESQIN
ncbi:MAG: sporulation protein [Moorea sp. SIO4G2]|uniref:Sporulation protein SpoOM n=2 Tax=Moorena TaxID=1155738 RepID=A0A1D8TWH7_9CYAN|nr:sporulation protein [Moorena producens]AOX01934.1 sporulation protein SpoOM [Moorena producens PAL-8-15-08-1]NEO58994.1 sporulation protein [Moorena sp. SIO4G2]